jgi:hypothetical protein
MPFSFEGHDVSIQSGYAKRHSAEGITPFSRQMISLKGRFQTGIRF